MPRRRKNFESSVQKKIRVREAYDKSPLRGGGLFDASDAKKTQKTRFGPKRPQKLQNGPNLKRGKVQESFRAFFTIFFFDFFKLGM